ncbi:MAG: HRDC domain-containing protein [Actinomycetota bacterium]|nr:HRDC domain-containing protein [Actinomycetota bacterium]
MAELARSAREAGRLAIDTEFMSERHYQALLCLVQVAVADGGEQQGVRTEVVDPLADIEPGPLAEALADPTVEVIVHAGRQDVAILRRTWHTEVTNVFDTQVAAAFLGYGLQEGYKALVHRVLGVDVPATEAFTRWDRRPLTDHQLEYARADAAHLLTLGRAMEDQLTAAGRLEWAREECRALEQSSDDRDVDALFKRLPRAARLKARERAIAYALVRWREDVASELDRPAASVLADHVLVELARTAPSTPEQLAAARGLPAQTLHRRSRELLEAIRAGTSTSPPAVHDEAPRPDARNAPLVALAQAVVRHRALKARIATELIATQADLAALVGDVRSGTTDPRSRVLRGWRRDLVGDELLDLLAGRRRVGIGADGLEIAAG